MPTLIFGFFTALLPVLNASDTIAAVSTAVGPAARMVVRASGPDALDILWRLCRDVSVTPPLAVRTRVRLGSMDVPAWAYAFSSPRTYTGDDLIELHLPGNPRLVRLVLQRMIALGARHAEAGEFTARAFFNGRLDLAQAEGVAAVVSAGGAAQLDAARRLMAGELSRRLRPAMDVLAETLALVEVEIDFSEEDVRFLSADQIRRRVAGVDAELDDLVRTSARFERLAHEPTVVLAGRPNAGKSTLLNALAGSARAVVSPAAGTTRDALSAHVALKRGIVRMVDVAGLEEPTEVIESAPDAIDAQMCRRALREVESADVLVLVRDATDLRAPLILPRAADLTVLNKIDLLDAPLFTPDAAPVSAVTGDGFGLLRDTLDAVAFGADSVGSTLALNARHLQAVAAARAALVPPPSAWTTARRS